MARISALRPQLEVQPNGSAPSRNRWSTPDNLSAASGWYYQGTGTGRTLRCATTSTTGVNIVGAPKFKALAQGVLVKFQFTGVTNHRFNVHLSSSGLIQSSTSNEKPTSAYSAQIAQTGNLAVFKRLAGTDTQLGTTVTGAAVGTGIFWMRFERTATNVRVRVWADGAAEPAGWGVDVAETSLAAGVPHFTYQRSSGTDAVDILQWDVYNPAGVVALTPGPRLWLDEVGHPRNLGRTRQTRLDDGQESTSPAWMSISPMLRESSYDATNMIRSASTIAVTSDSVTWSLASCPASKGVRIDLDGFGLSATTAVRFEMGFTGSDGKVYQVSDDAANSYLNLVADTVTQGSISRWIENTNTFRRNISVLLSPQLGQLYVISNTDQIEGWVDLPGAVTATVTPFVKITTTSAAVRSVSYRQLRRVVYS